MQTEPQDTPDRIETPEGAEALCARVLGTISDLVGVLDRETDLLRRNKPQEITALHVRKSALSTAMTHDMALLKRDADYIKMAAPDHIEAIKERQSLFQKSLAANYDALAAMRAVSESLLRTIADTVSARRSGPEVYGKGAEVSGMTPKRPAAISVDTTL
ncbi:MAG: hypothetical protein ACR2PO_00455 [Methyloligellaceae bacterium]